MSNVVPFQRPTHEDVVIAGLSNTERAVYEAIRASLSGITDLGIATVICRSETTARARRVRLVELGLVRYTGRKVEGRGRERMVWDLASRVPDTVPQSARKAKAGTQVELLRLCRAFLDDNRLVKGDGRVQPQHSKRDAFIHAMGELIGWYEP